MLAPSSLEGLVTKIAFSTIIVVSELLGPDKRFSKLKALLEIFGIDDTSKIWFRPELTGLVGLLFDLLLFVY